MKKLTIKKAITTAIAASGLMASSLILAGTQAGPTPPTPPDNTAVITAINNLGNKLEALSIAGIKAVNNAAHQFNESLPTLKFVNNEKSEVADAVKKEIMGQTTNNVANDLQEISNLALTYNTKTADVQQVAQQIQNRTDLRNSLVTTPASDTLYSDIVGVDGTSSALAKPSHLYDNYLSFSSLFSPEAYSADQQTAANYYLDYLTNRYNSLADGVNFDKLKSTLNQYKNNPDKLGNKLSSFMNSDAYRTYEMSLRSMTANKSVALNNLNTLMIERTPIETDKPNPTLEKLSEAIGVQPTQEQVTDPNNPNNKIKVYAYASPLQISSYVANHRVESNQWYQSMSSASNETLQRENVYILAEIESQLHQQHVDSERLLATLTALQLQSSITNQMALKAQADDVNSAIDGLSDDDNSQTLQPSNHSNSSNNNGTGANGGGK